MYAPCLNPILPYFLGTPLVSTVYSLLSEESTNIRGLLAMIARSVPYDNIRYILGATGEGHRQLHEDLALPILWVDYLFINSDERVTTGLLSNPVLEYLLDLWVYGESCPGDQLTGHTAIVEAQLPCSKGRCKLCS